jgi:hypothetical protein
MLTMKKLRQPWFCWSLKGVAMKYKSTLDSFFFVNKTAYTQEKMYTKGGMCALANT